MKINLSNFETSDVSLFDVSIVQRDVGGGKTERQFFSSVFNELSSFSRL